MYVQKVVLQTNHLYINDEYKLFYTQIELKMNTAILK